MPERLLSHKIIIGVAIYNEGPYILQTLESLCDQTYTDFRVLISDNASTDGTGDICRDFCQKDHRFSYVCHSRNMGVHNSSNYIIDVTDSEYLMLMGGHDMVESTFLAKHVAILDSKPEISLSYSQTACIGDKGQFLQHTSGGDYVFPAEMGSADRYASLAKVLTYCEAVNQMFRRKWREGCVLQPVISGDHILLCHAIAHGPFYRIDEPLYIRRYFQRGTNIEKMKREQMERVAGKNGQDINYLDFTVNYINDVRTHPAIPAEQKAALTWFLIQVLQNRFQVFQPFDEMKYTYPEPAEIISNMQPCLETDK